MKVINKLFLLLIISSGQTFPGEVSQPSTLQNIYSTAAAQLSRAKEAVTNIFFGDSEEYVSAGMTIAEASAVVRQIIDKKPKAAGDEYWKLKSTILLRCAKRLLEETQNQLLKTLQEIDKRLLYWTYQNDHQWQYFISKSPLKWVMGKRQAEEIRSNIEQLQGKQDELYTRLGELSSIDWHEYLLAFNTYQASYAWIAKLLNMISGMYDDVTVPDNDYDVITRQLNRKLARVSTLASTILTSMSDSALPYYIVRHWLKFGVLLAAANFAYTSPEVAELIKQVPGKARELETAFYDTLKRVKKFINETFFGGTGEKSHLTELLGMGKEGGGLIIQQATREETRKELEKFLDTSVPQGWAFAGIAAATPDEKKKILHAFDKNDWAPSLAFFTEKAASSWSKEYMLRGIGVVVQVVAAATGNNSEQALFRVLDEIDKKSQGVLNLILLTPAAVVTGAGLYGMGKGYGWLTKRDYTPLRIGLVDISSLFVDQTKPLDNTDYGKMIYLLYNLKERAKKDLPIATRNEFIKDLDRIESRDFDAAAKRRIIKDMFKKYSFLGLVR